MEPRSVVRDAHFRTFQAIFCDSNPRVVGMRSPLLPALLVSLLVGCGSDFRTGFDIDAGAASTDASSTKDADAPKKGDAASPVDASLPPPSSPSLAIVSGDGTTVPSGWPAGDPLRVRATSDGTTPVVGATVRFTLSKGNAIHVQAPNGEVTTDSDGIASVSINAFGIQPFLGYDLATVTASWNGKTADFSIIVTAVPQGNAPMPPLIQYEVPSGTHDLGTAKAGSILKGAIVALAVFQQGPSQGQPVPGWGFRLTNTSDTLASADVACVPGTVIADSKGIVTCDVQVPSKPGSYYFMLFAAGQLRWSDGHLTAN